jgi:hypothetical protein
VAGCRYFDANGGLLGDYGVRRGKRHGREYRWDVPCTLLSWSLNELHGIEREWTDRGRLRPGFPRFHVRGRRATRRTYDREQKRDPSLPSYKHDDNLPERIGTRFSGASCGGRRSDA